MTELKPCPKCGEYPYVKTNRVGLVHHAYCECCGIESEVVSISEETECNSQGIFQKLVNLAATAWNKCVGENNEKKMTIAEARDIARYNRAVKPDDALEAIKIFNKAFDLLEEFESNPPLTEKQIRGMVGKPVWVEYIDEPNECGYKVIEAISPQAENAKLQIQLKLAIEAIYTVDQENSCAVCEFNQFPEQCHERVDECEKTGKRCFKYRGDLQGKDDK